MVLKVATQTLAVLAVAVLFTACGERAKHEEKEMAAPPAGCCQQANAMCESPLTEDQCNELRGTFVEGGSCGDDGQCVENPQLPQ